MKVTHYQIEKDYITDTCRFVYEVNGVFKIASVQNFTGMIDFLILSGATRLDNSVNIYEFTKQLNPRVLFRAYVSEDCDITDAANELTFKGYKVTKSDETEWLLYGSCEEALITNAGSFETVLSVEKF